MVGILNQEVYGLWSRLPLYIFNPLHFGPSYLYFSYYLFRLRPTVYTSATWGLLPLWKILLHYVHWPPQFCKEHNALYSDKHLTQTRSLKLFTWPFVSTYEPGHHFSHNLTTVHNWKLHLFLLLNQIIATMDPRFVHFVFQYRPRDDILGKRLSKNYIICTFTYMQAIKG